MKRRGAAVVVPAATGTERVGTGGDCGVTGDDDDGGGGDTRGAGGGGDGGHPNGGAGGGGDDKVGGWCTGMGDGEVDDDADNNADVTNNGGAINGVLVGAGASRGQHDEGTGRPHAWGGTCTDTDAWQDGAAAAPRTPAPQQAWMELHDDGEETTADRFVRWARVKRLE